MSWLGLDVGTSGCKAAAFAADGSRLGYAYRAYATIHPAPGRVELDSAAVLVHCQAVVAEAAQAASQAGSPVRALAVSSQGEAFTPIDGAGRPLANAMVSSDTRAAGIVAAWADRRERLYAVTGHTAHPLFSLFKLLWLRRHAPEVYARAAAFLCFEDLVHRQLGVEPAMGWSLAGRTMLFDVRRGTWDEALLADVGLKPSRLARPLPPGALVGVVPRTEAAAWGLPPEVRVVAAGHDQTVAALGAGVVRPGMAMYATGTVECVVPVFAQPVFTPALRDANLCTYAAALPGAWATVAFSLTGGNLLRWFRDELGGVEAAQPDAYERLLQLADRAPSELLVLPYFTASGTPYFDANTPGAVLGLRLTTTRGELLRGLLEGVALEMRLNLDLLAEAGVVIDALRATGGGARSAVWNQLKADVLGRPLTTVAESEAGCLGAAALAAAADLGGGPGEVATAWVRPGRTFHPDPARAAAYEQRFAQYRGLYPVLRDLQRAATPSAEKSATAQCTDDAADIGGGRGNRTSKPLGAA